MSKTKTLKLIKIALETKDGKQVELTIEEAKELHDQLHALFGGRVVQRSVSGDSDLSFSYCGETN
jgi:hypothetical protein